MAKAIKAWWCGWTFPIDAATDDRVAAKWPEGVTGWVSGQSETRFTYTARVEATSDVEAHAKLLSMYGGDLGTLVEWRWDPMENPIEWWPEPSRFPRPTRNAETRR